MKREKKNHAYKNINRLLCLLLIASMVLTPAERIMAQEMITEETVGNADEFTTMSSEAEGYDEESNAYGKEADVYGKEPEADGIEADSYGKEQEAGDGTDPEAAADTEAENGVPETEYDEPEPRDPSELTGLVPVEFLKIPDGKYPEGYITVDLTKEEDESEIPGISNDTAAVYYDSYWDQYTNYYFYNKLSAKEKALYDGLCKTNYRVLNGEGNLSRGYYGYTTGAVSYGGVSTGRAKTVAWLVYFENPQFYFLNGQIEYGGSSIALIADKDFVNGATRSRATAKLKSTLDTWVREVKAGSTELDRERIAFSIIGDRVKYDTSAPHNQRSYSAIVEGRSVCAGYSQALMMLLNATGFDALYITSKTHAWNVVRAGGTWYHCDSTWGTGEGWGYTFFNRDTASMLRNDSMGSHFSETMWDSLLPEFTRDSGSTRREAKLPSPTGTATEPEVIAALKSGTTYTVYITDADGDDVWYTVSSDASASVPAPGYSKATKYTKPFDVKYGTKIMATSVRNDYLDSSSVECTRWIRAIKISYDCGKGLNDPANPQLISSDDSPFDLKDPAYIGYTFDGWYTDKKYANRISHIVPDECDTDIKLYAKWIKNEITITPDISSLNAGETVTLKAEVTPASAASKIIWNISDSSVVDVSGENTGSLTLKAHATDLQKRIVVSAAQDNILNHAESVVIIERVVSPERVITDKQTVILDKGVSTGLITSIEPSDAQYESITYKSSNTSAVTVTPVSGNNKRANISAVNPGEADITVEVRSLTGKVTSHTMHVSVNPDDTVTSGYTDVKPASEADSQFWIGGIANEGYTFTGKALKPQIRVYRGTTRLLAGTDYAVSYKNNVKLNDASNLKTAPMVIVKFKGNYSGSISGVFKIVESGSTAPDAGMKVVPTDLGKLGSDDLNISVPDIAAAKGGVKPPVTVTVKTDAGSVKLIEGEDYTLAYSSNNSVSKPGVVTVKGMGAYKGSVKRGFNILPQSLKNVNMAVADVTYSKSKGAFKKTQLTLTDIDGKVLKAGTDYTADFVTADGSQIPEVGTDIYVTVTGKGNYTDTLTGVFKVKKATIAKAKVTVYTDDTFGTVAKSFAYTGMPVEPQYYTVNVGTVKDPVILVEGRDFVVCGYTDNIKKGKAVMTIRGIGDYAGIKTIPYTIAVRNVNAK